jgi:hypothetical protein
VSQQKRYEAATIEEALRAVAIDLGEDIEIVEAVKERRGGMLGFFAKEVFVVTAHAKTSVEPKEPDQEFGDLLLQLASGVADTWEPEGDLPQRDRTAQPQPAPAIVTPALERVATQPQAGVIDLRTGRRRPAPVVPLATASRNLSADNTDRPERPSNLRKRLLGGVPEAQPEQYVMEVDGPMVDLRDSVPRWSLARLQMLGLPDPVLHAIERLDPTRDLEWVQSLSVAISKLNPDPGVELTYVVGHGRRSAVQLITGIAQGRIPTALILDGQRVKVTPDELALAIRACVR